MGDDLTKYTGFDMDMLEETDRRVEEVGGSAYVKLEVGDTIVRILPAPAGQMPFRVTSLHYIDAVPGLDKKIVFACPRVEEKKPCLACTEADRLLSTGNPLDRASSKRISGTLTVYANALDRSMPDAGPKILSMGSTIWKKLKAIRQNPRAGGDFTDPGDGGFDIIISREGTGPRDTRYEVSTDRNNSPLADTPEEIEMILSRQHNLDAEVDTEIPEDLIMAWRNLASVGRGQTQRRSSAVADAQKTTVVDDDDPTTW